MTAWLVAYSNPRMLNVVYVRPDRVVSLRVSPTHNDDGYHRFVAELRTCDDDVYFGSLFMGEADAMADVGAFMQAIDAYVLGQLDARRPGGAE